MFTMKKKYENVVLFEGDIYFVGGQRRGGIYSRVAFNRVITVRVSCIQYTMILNCKASFVEGSLELLPYSRRRAELSIQWGPHTLMYSWS